MDKTANLLSKINNLFKESNLTKEQGSNEFKTIKIDYEILEKYNFGNFFFFRHK